MPTCIDAPGAMAAVANGKARHLWLIGPRGSGKSSFARRIRDRYGPVVTVVESPTVGYLTEALNIRPGHLVVADLSEDGTDFRRDRSVLTRLRGAIEDCPGRLVVLSTLPPDSDMMLMMMACGTAFAMFNPDDADAMIDALGVAATCEDDVPIDPAVEGLVKRVGTLESAVALLHEKLAEVGMLSEIVRQRRLLCAGACEEGARQ